MTADADLSPQPDQTAQLEEAFILEFLERRGHTRGTLHTLAEPEVHALLREASAYASAKLAEVESRWHYVREIHAVTDRT
jgi:hypothetical protein